MWPGSSLNLNLTQKLQGISLQELESRPPFISLWQLTERRKSVWANIFGDTAKGLISNLPNQLSKHAYLSSVHTDTKTLDFWPVLICFMGMGNV